MHWWRLRAGRSVACLSSALHVTKWSGQDLADASYCARCAAADLRCKRLLGRTGTPCGHFTPDAAPPLSLCFAHTSPTAPPTRRCVQLHVPAESYSVQHKHGRSSRLDERILGSSGAMEGVLEAHACPDFYSVL